MNFAIEEIFRGKVNLVLSAPSAYEAKRAPPHMHTMYIRRRQWVSSIQRIIRFISNGAPLYKVDVPLHKVSKLQSNPKQSMFTSYVSTA